MWTRRELKEKGKTALRRSYWKTVLVSLIMLFIMGGVIGGSAAPSSWLSIGYHGRGDDSAVSEPADIDIDDIMDDSVTLSPENTNELNQVINGFQEALNGISLVAVTVTILMIVLIIAAAGVAISAFLTNPLEAGGARFFIRNLNTNAEVKELAYCYDHGYLNTVKTIFFKDLYTILWSLLLIIPGIVKTYEYRMMPYILAENPGMPTKEVFARSREMMRGQKWKTFVLDLSFIGWGILSLITFGIVGVFYVNPYRSMTNAALYERLAYGNEEMLLEQKEEADGQDPYRG